MNLNLNEIKDRMGEKVYIESKPSYNQISGTYILCGLQQTLELDETNRRVWKTQICVKERNTRCRIWFSADGASITFLSSMKDESEAEIINPTKSIQDIQAETIAKIKKACE